MASGASAFKSGQVNQRAIAKLHLPISRSTQSTRTARNDIEHRLHVGRRTRNDTKNLTGSRLPLQCLLRLVEQPHVLNGDDGLVGEGLEELDLSVRERLD